MDIRLLPNLDLSRSGLISFHDRRLSEENRVISLRQGDLDGACGPYALMMALLAFGAITRKDALNLWMGKVDGRAQLSKVIASLETLLRHGTHASDLIKLFEAVQRYSALNGLACNANLQRLQISAKEVRGQALFKLVKESIDSGVPAILTLEWSHSDAHWVTAIGYQTYKKNVPDPDSHATLESILVLDPSSSASPTSAWNGVLAVNPGNGSLPFNYWNNDQSAVSCDADGCLFFQTP